MQKPTFTTLSSPSIRSFSTTSAPMAFTQTAARPLAAKEALRAKGLPALPAARPTVAMQASGNFGLARTLKEKSASSIINEAGNTTTIGAFTRANEKFVSRVAMVGMAGTIVGEAITGNGALAQFDLDTGFTLAETEDLLVLQILIVAGLALAGLASGAQAVDPKAIDAQQTFKFGSLRESFGLAPEGQPLFGFTEANELFLGRTAQLAFAFTTAIEAFTGFGPLKQLGVETGLSTGIEEEAILLPALFFALASVVPSLIGAAEPAPAPKAAPKKKGFF